MKELKCPYCNKPLVDRGYYDYMCPDECDGAGNIVGNESMWDTLIAIKEERDKFEQHYKCLSHVFKHQIEVNDFLNVEANKLQKKLDRAIEVIEWYAGSDSPVVALEALKELKKEQQ